MGRGRAILLGALLGLGGILVAALFLLGVLPIRDLSSRPARAYSSTEVLADALNEGGFGCDYRRNPEAPLGTDSAFCRDPGESPPAAVFLHVYPDDEDARRAEGDFARCGYLDAVFGPNWSAMGRGEHHHEAILKIVGGRLVQGKNDC